MLLQRVITPVKIISEQAEKISKGDFNIKRKINRDDETGDLEDSFQKIITVVKQIKTEIESYIQKVQRGEFNRVKIDKSAFEGEYKEIAEGLNTSAKVINSPFIQLLTYTNSIAKGNIPKPIEDEYDGNFQILKKSMNTMISTLEKLTSEMNQMYKEQASGDYEYYINDTHFDGIYQHVAQGYNQVVKLHVDNILSIIDIVAEYGDGNFENEMPVLPGKQIAVTQIINGVRKNLLAVIEELNMVTDKIKKGKLKAKTNTEGHKGEFHKILQSVNDALDSIVKPLGGLVGNMTQIVRNIKNGELDKRLDTNSHIPEFAVVSQGINAAFNALIRPLNKTADTIDKIAKGEIPEEITEEYKGDFNIIKNNLNTLINVIGEIVKSVNQFIENTKEGEIEKTKFDKDMYSGTFKEIIGGLNEIAAYVSMPLTDLSSALSGLAKGDLPAHLRMEGYRGGWLELRDSLNSLIDITSIITDKAKQIAEGNLTIELQKRSENDMLMIAFSTMSEKMNEVVETIKDATDYVASGSAEININAQNLAQGANEQAASVEEVSSSIEEMEATINQNSDNATTTEKTAIKAANNIEIGSKSVQETVQAMQQIIEKIRVVKEIADKTDLLAINAAIEAARAGEYGEGFAVVAGEVRKLAEMSKQAALEINEVSRQSLNTAQKSGTMLESIVPQIKSTAQLVQEIASASIEQNGGIQQITTAITQLNNISQQNASSAEELSTGSEELTTQADALRESISFFKVKQKDAKSTNKDTKDRKQEIQSHKKKKQNGFNINLEDSNDDSDFEKL